MAMYIYIYIYGHIWAYMDIYVHVCGHIYGYIYILNIPFLVWTILIFARCKSTKQVCLVLLFLCTATCLGNSFSVFVVFQV